MSIIKNYLYNLSYQLILMIIPVITIPYISRILGSNGIGINAYTYSITQYFIILGSIGISIYGNREIAYVRGNKLKLSKTFWGIFLLRIITMLFSFFLFLLFLNFFTENLMMYFLLQSIYICAAAIDISWLYMGLEDFKKTVIRNLFVKIIGLFCIFIFVKESGDLWKYIFILAISQLIGNLSLWMYLPKTVLKVHITWKDIVIHLRPSFALFIPQIAVQIYIVLNKSMLGFLSNINEVGYFDNADKIVKIILSIVTAMGTVMLPRMSNTFARGELNQVKEYLYNSFNFACYLSIPLTFGIAALANTFAPWFFGPEFSKTGNLLIIISPIIIFIAWSNALGQQYLMPIGKIKEYTASVVTGAIVNFLLNLLLIKQFQSYGASIATLFSEISVTIVQLSVIRQEVEIKKLFKSNWKYFVSSLIMFIVIKIISRILETNLLTIIIQVIIGSFIYFLLLFLFRSSLNKRIMKIGYNFTRKIFN